MSSFTPINSIENLESRLLLAGFASLNAHGVLSVVGDSKSNLINVVYNLNTVKVTRDGISLSFDKAKVKKIWAEGFGGNDKITINVPLPSTLIGDGGNDTLVGNTGDDQLFGGSGDDDLVGADGSNRLDPGTGNDVIDYSAQIPGNFSSDGETNITHQIIGKVFSNDFIVSTSNPLTILLTPGNDSFNAMDSFTNWIIIAGAGNDSIDLFDASVFSIFSGTGNDSVYFDNHFGGFVDTGKGNDFIQEDGGHGTNLEGGPGLDTYIIVPDPFFSGQNPYEVTVPPGFENFSVSSDNSLIVHSNQLNNNITAHAGNVTVYGNAGNDRITVQPDNASSVDNPGHALADGGSGNDTLVGSLATVFKGGPGNDTADFSASTADLNISLDNVANDGIAGQNANVLPDVENILGGSGNDKLVGNPLNNVLKGGTGNDTLWGGAGNDTLTGGPGHDMLFGQGDNDTLLAKDGQVDSLDGGAGFDKAQRDNTASIKDQVLNIEAFI